MLRFVAKSLELPNSIIYTLVDKARTRSNEEESQSGACFVHKD